MSALARANAVKAAKEAKAGTVFNKLNADVEGDEEAVAQMLKDEKLVRRQRRRTASDYSKAGPLAPCLAAWKNASVDVQQLLTTDAWEFTILATICFAGVLVGVQTFPGYEDDPFISWLDMIVLAIFTVEVLLKVFSEGFQPWRFWVGENWHWNNFDFVVVALCMPFVPVGSYVSVLRLARLARLIKIVDKIPQLKMIVLGMIGGLRAIFFICCLLFLVFYLYGIAGIVLFEENDPWHFSNFADSMTTLFRMSTMEDWTDVMCKFLYPQNSHYSTCCLLFERLLTSDCVIHPQKLQTSTTTAATSTTPASTTTPRNCQKRAPPSWRAPSAATRRHDRSLALSSASPSRSSLGW